MCPLTMSSPLLIFIFVAKVSGGRAISEEIWDPFNVEKKKQGNEHCTEKEWMCDSTNCEIGYNTKQDDISYHFN